MVDVTLSLIGANGDEIVFSDEGDFVLTAGLAGLGIPATQVRIDDSASDGGVWRFSKRGVRELDLPVVVLGADRATVEANLRRLTLLLSDRVGGVVLQAAYSSGEVWHLTQGHYVAGASGIRGDDGGLAWERWVLSLQFANPFWVSQASESFAVGAPSSTGSFLPNLAELVVSSAQAVGSVTVENPGDVDAFPVWSLRGPADSVTISNGSESFVYDAAISASSTVVVDAQAGTVVDQAGVNKYGSLGVSPSLFALPAGTSQVSVTATNASAGSWTEVETLATNLVTNPSMEASSGTVTVRTNLVTNPSMESVTSGSVVMRRNLVTNPSFEVGTTGWGGSATISRVTSEFFLGSASLQVVTTASSQRVEQIPTAPVAAGGTYTASAYVKAESGKTFTIELRELAADGTTIIGTTISSTLTGTGSWQRVSISRLFGATGVNAQIILRNQTAGAHTFYVDAVMLEASSVVGDFFDGSTTDALGWDYAWSGTANASISTAACAATTVRTNLSTNPNSETSAMGAAGAGTGTASQSSTQKMSGTYSTKYVWASGAWGAVPVNVAVTVGTTYTASFYLFSESGVIPTFAVTNQSYATIPSTGTYTTTTVGSWVRLNMTFTPAAGTTSVFVYATPSAASTYYIDNVLVETGSLGDFFDGSFQPAGDFSYAWTGTANASTSIARGATPSGWATQYAGTTISSNAQQYVGSRSIRFDSSLQYGNTVCDSTVTASQTYTGSVWVKGESGKQLYVELEERTSGGAVVGVTSGALTTATGSWQRLSVTRAFGSTGVIARLRAASNTAIHTMYVDAALVEASPIVQDYFDGSVVSADADLTNSWSGTAHASTSLMRGVGVASSTQGGGTASIQSTGWSSTGTKSIRIIPATTGNNSWVRFDIPTTVGETYTVMGKLRQTQALAGSQWPNARRINAYNSGLSIVVGQSAQAANAAGIYSHSVTFVAASTTTPILLGNGASAGNGDVWWDDLIVVAGTYTGGYFDGNSTTLRENGYAWTGTANASTSTWKRREIQGATLISCNYQPRKEIVH